jgi:hypothetical protein
MTMEVCLGVPASVNPISDERNPSGSGILDRTASPSRNHSSFRLG